MRNREPSVAGGNTTLFVVGVLVVCTLTMAVVLGIIALAQPPDRLTLIAAVTAFTLPIVLAFLAAALREVHLGMNSRLTELLLLTATSARAEGRLIENKLPDTDPTAKAGG